MSSRAHLLATTLLVLGPLGAAEQEIRGAAEAGALAGIWSLRTVSEVRMAAAPEDLHTLEVALAFPDRTRWTLRRAGSRERRIELRFGEHGFFVPVDSETSSPLEGAEREALLRRSRLREALFLWPEGARWTGEGGTRSAPLDGVAGSDPEAGLGRLEAGLDADGRLAWIRCRDRAGALEETLEVLAWREVEGRTWPERLRLSYRDEAVWEERVTEINPTLRLHDRYFVPADRHELLRPYARVERLRVEETFALRRELAPESAWAHAAAAAARLHAEVAARGAAALDPRPWVLCDAAGRPAAIEVRLAAGHAGRPPDGWSRRERRDAVRLSLGGSAAPDAADLSRLRAGVPDGRRAAPQWRVGLGAVDLELVLELDP